MDGFQQTVFKDLAPLDLERLAGITTTINVKAGDYFFRKGDESNSFFILFSGRVIISKEVLTEDDKIFEMDLDSANVHFKYFYSGQLFGETDFFDRSVRTQAVSADVDCLVGEIRYDDCIRLKYQHPDL